MLDFDEMLVQVGEFGLYQKALFLFQAPFCMFVTFVLFGQLFMTLYPMTIWCEHHFACTTGNMTPFQRENFSIPYTRGALNPCFIHKIETSFVKAVADYSNSGSCGAPACNYTQGREDISPHLRNAQALLGFLHPQQIARGYGAYQSGSGNYYGYTTVNPNSRGGYRGYGAGYGGGGAGNDRGGGGSWTTETTYEYTTTEGIVFEPMTSTSRWPETSGGGGASGTTKGPGGSGGGTSRPGQPGGRVTTRPSGSGGGRPGEPAGTIGGMTSPLRMNNSASCPRFVDTMMHPRARIFMREMNSTTTSDSFEPLTPTSCRVRFNRTQTGIPYDTIVIDGNWWCNTEAYLTASQAVFFLGAIVGGFLIGWVADSYGRVPALVIANVFGAVGGALSVVSTNVWLFMFFRFITGMAFDNCFTMMYILVLEFCGPSYRTLVANLSIAVFYTLGTLILPWLAVFIGNWQIYGLAISLPMLLGLLAIFFVPESARWLLSKGRTKEATDILRSFAKVNKKTVDEKVFVEFEKEARTLYDEMIAEEEDTSFTAALKTPRLRRTFILLVLIWSMIALVYDGHSRNILNLADEQWNVFWMFTIASMTEFPADMLLIFTLDRFGRRWLSFGSLTLSGAASIIAATIPADMRVLGLVMAIVSRFFVNVAFNIGLQYAAELLPTVIRAQGVNAIHIMGYVASIISPFVAAIGRTNPTLSLLLLGTFAIIGGCLSLFLAETLGEDLPNSLEEAELFGINQSFWNCPICAKPRDEEHMPIEEPQDIAVIRRNNLRSSVRGETYRSSIISSSSRGSRRGPHVALNPIPNETTKLRRITH